MWRYRECVAVSVAVMHVVAATTCAFVRERAVIVTLQIRDTHRAHQMPVLNELRPKRAEASEDGARCADSDAPR